MNAVISHTYPTSPQKSVPTTFSLLSWNLHKECHTDTWTSLFEKIVAEYDPNFFFFQELDFHEKRFDLYHQKGYHFYFLPNITLLHRKRTQAGIATLSTVDSSEHISFFTDKKEPLVQAAKPMLVSHYPMKNGSTLLLVNIHGINFVRTHHFEKQFAQLTEVISAHQGPAVIGGDFNSWSQKRVNQIETFFAQILHQKYCEVPFGKESLHIKKAPYPVRLLFGNHSLDRFYYSSKYLSLSKPPQVLSEIKGENIDFSDHRPLFMTFSLSGEDSYD